MARASWHVTYESLVILDHTSEISPGQDPILSCYVYTLYGHLENTSAGLGQMVNQGEVIGTVGNTGNAKGMEPHLHFEAVRAPKRLEWNTQGNTGIDAGLYRMEPFGFIGGFSLPDECFPPSR